MSGRLILIRHGEPVGHAGRCIGHHDTELAASALEPLRRLAETATNGPMPRLVLASDLRRAADSATVLARTWKAELRFDPRLREVSFGEWEGRTWEDIARDDRAALDAWGSDWTTHSAPGGESGVALSVRATAAMNEIVAIAASTDVAVVSHAGWIRVATTILLREPIASAFAWSIDYARAAIFDLSVAPCLEQWNVDRLDAAAVRSASAPPRAQPSTLP